MQNQSLLASSLQTAHNLRVLPALVQDLVTDLAEAVDGRIRYAFDLSRISKEVLTKGTLLRAPISIISIRLSATNISDITEGNAASHGLMYKSRVRTEPTNVTAPQYTAVLWSSLEGLIEEMTSCCVKVCPNPTVPWFYIDHDKGVCFGERVEAQT